MAVAMAPRTIYALRHEKGWSQSDLARLLGVDKQSVKHWENGRRNPKQARLEQLSQLFDVPVNEIALVAPDGSLFISQRSGTYAGYAIA